MVIYKIKLKIQIRYNRLARYIRQRFAHVYECDQCGHYYKLDGEKNECMGCYDPKRPDYTEHAWCTNQNGYEHHDPCEGELHKDGTCKVCGGDNELSFFVLNRVRSVFGYLDGISYNKYQHMRWIIENDTIPRIHDMKYTLERRLHELYARLHR